MSPTKLHQNNLSDFPTTHPTNQLGKTHKALTVWQALSAFTQTLERKNNYVPVVRNYLLFTVAQDLLLNDFSRDRYFEQYSKDRKLGYNISSPVRKFLRFAHQQGIHRVVADEERTRVPPAANDLILGYLSSAKNLRGEKTKQHYTLALNSFFEWLKEEQRSFDLLSVSAYLDYLVEKCRSPSTVNFYLSVIKGLARWVVTHCEQREEFSADQLLSLHKIQYIRGMVYRSTPGK